MKNDVNNMYNIKLKMSKYTAAIEKIQIFILIFILMKQINSLVSVYYQTY